MAAPYATDRVLIRFKPGANREFASLSGTNLLAAMVSRLGLPAGAGLKEPAVRKLLRERLKGAVAQTSTTDLDLGRFLYLELPPALTVEQCLRLLDRHPLLDYAEPDFIGSGGATIPNDPNFSSQWHHKNLTKPSACIHTPDAWDITQGSTNIIVAILDTGLGTGLTEFAGRTVPGYNFVSNTTDTADDYGHGTAVAGTLCANANNNVLVAGVDWRCRLMPVKVLDQNNYGYYSWWAQGIDYAVANGAKVINLSAGGSSSDTTLTASISNAIAQGAIFVTITHNDGTSTIRFPGNLPMSITLGASDQQDRRCGFSNFGPQIDLVAPGTNIYTVSRYGTLDWWWGTSFAAPQAAGVCALMAAIRPDLTQDQARTLLCAGADDQVGDAADTPSFDNYYGWGRLNGYNSLVLAQTHIDQITRLTNDNIMLSWTSPPNGSNRQPYRIEFATDLNGPWTTLTNATGFQYSTNRTTWIDDGAATGTNFTASALFYRVRIWQP